MKAAIGISFGEGNNFNQQIRISSLLNNDVFYMKNNFQVVSDPVSKILHMAALRYVLTTCRYLGIDKVAVATENFSMKSQLEFIENYPPSSFGNRYGPLRHVMQNILTQTTNKQAYWMINSSKKVFEYVMKGPREFRDLSLYQMLHLLNLMEDVDLQLVQTGRVDQKVLAELAFRNIRGASFDFDADFEEEGTDAGDFVSRIMNQLQKGEITVAEARARISVESPTVLSECIFADYNRQILKDFCPESAQKSVAE